MTRRSAIPASIGSAPSDGPRTCVPYPVLLRREHPAERGEMPARAGENLGVGGMIGTLDGDDAAAQLRVLVAQVGCEFLLGLRRPDHENLVRSLERLRGVIEKVAIGGRLVATMGAFAAVHAFMLIMRMDVGARLLGRSEMPDRRLLVVDPNDRMIV